MRHDSVAALVGANLFDLRSGSFDADRVDHNDTAKFFVVEKSNRIWTPGNFGDFLTPDYRLTGNGRRGFRHSIALAYSRSIPGSVQLSSNLVDRWRSPVRGGHIFPMVQAKGLGVSRGLDFGKGS